MNSQRRYDIDWLRVIAIGLLLIYHVAIGFQPWGMLIGFIKNDDPMEWLWVLMSTINVWRIPLLFYVSGMGVYFAIQRRDWEALMLERTKRILVPFIFGTLVIVPLHVVLWSDYYHQDWEYYVHPFHLWFLGHIFIYVVLFSPVFFYLKNRPEGYFKRLLEKTLSTPLGLILLIVPFIIEAFILNPDPFEMYAQTWHGFWLGMIAFIAGFLSVYAGKSFWENVSKLRWITFVIASGMYFYRLIEGELRSPNYLMAIESNLWIFALLGMSVKHLNRPGKILSYLSEAAYPVYILHMLFLYLGSWILFPTSLSAFLKFVLVNLVTFGGCFLTYELLVRRVTLLRPLFGLKTIKARNSGHIDSVREP